MHRTGAEVLTLTQHERSRVCVFLEDCIPLHTRTCACVGCVLRPARAVRAGARRAPPKPITSYRNFVVSSQAGQKKRVKIRGGYGKAQHAFTAMEIWIRSSTAIIMANELSLYSNAPVAGQPASHMRLCSWSAYLLSTERSGELVSRSTAKSRRQGRYSSALSSERSCSSS